jgi:hypothetical protein
MKKSIIVILLFVILGAGTYFVISIKKQSPKPLIESREQGVLADTYSLSRDYLALRFMTNNVLVNAKNFSDYEAWNKEINLVISKWSEFDQRVASLELEANLMSEENISFHLINAANAYDKQEISDIFDKAPAGKKIATLAKHLGVDAKMAFKILKQDQAQVEADIWNDEGDTFKKLEVSATVIKDACKVAGFVGGIALTGGASALAAGSTLAKATIIVGGADLTLEVTEDAANIALGDKNKVSAIVGDVRKVTEPIATILAINEIPNNLKNGFEKFSSAMIAVEQFKGAAQDGKIIGIALPTASKEKAQFENIKKHKTPVYVSQITPEDISKWLEEQGIKSSDIDQRDVEEILGVLASTKKNSETERDVTIEPNSEVKVETASSTSAVELPVVSNGLSLVSPEGASFTPASGLNFSAKLSNPEAYMTNGKNVMVWCIWKFYLNDKLYSEKLNPSTIHANVNNICEYSTLLVKDKGRLKVEFSLERSTATKYSEQKNKETLVSTQRSYIVK